jgi:hypothetical protein
MVICENAYGYEKELRRLRGEAVKELRPKQQELYNKFDSIENPTKQDYENLYETETKLKEDCLKEVIDFENRHPVKPLYVFKKGRKYYKLTFLKNGAGLRISNKPIPMQILKSNDWILPITFPGSAVDVKVCQRCKTEFMRYKLNQKYCFSCIIDLKNKKNVKRKNCLNCGKLLPIGKHGKTKYCCGACRTAACKKRKSVIVSLDSSGERISF